MLSIVTDDWRREKTNDVREDVTDDGELVPVGSRDELIRGNLRAPDGWVRLERYSRKFLAKHRGFAFLTMVHGFNEYIYCRWAGWRSIGTKRSKEVDLMECFGPSVIGTLLSCLSLRQLRSFFSSVAGAASVPPAREGGTACCSYMLTKIYNGWRTTLPTGNRVGQTGRTKEPSRYLSRASVASHTS